ncbi:MAG: class I SAM-dependent methyltransferase [Rickettsiales bacterium]|nr:class I SAM-dependent methyltransferase [Rickettsiales bacterium]
MKKIKLRDSDFKTNTSILSIRLNNTDPSLPNINTFGKFDNHTHYLTAVDLLRNSSLEVEHQYEVFGNILHNKIKNYNRMLDIGIGNGEVSKFFGIHFKQIVAVDTNIESLDTLPKNHWENKTPIIKINGDILEQMPSLEGHYDLIMLSHILYYIPPASRHTLVNDLSKFLAPNGIMIITYNDGNDRSKITDYFGGQGFSFTTFEQYTEKRFKTGEHLFFQEKMNAQSLETMLHIVGVCLCDVNTKATRDELSKHLHTNFKNDNGEYEVSMTTHVLILGENLENSNEG